MRADDERAELLKIRRLRAARKARWGRIPSFVPAISLRQPWAWAVPYAGKIVENREKWSSCDYRGPVLVHAALGMTRSEYDLNARKMIDGGLARAYDSTEYDSSLPWLPPPDEIYRGGVIGLALISGVVINGVAIRPKPSDPDLDLVCPLTEKERRWWHGSFALLLSSAIALPRPVPCGGSLRLFTPPSIVYDEVESQLVEVAAGKSLSTYDINERRTASWYADAIRPREEPST